MASESLSQAEIDALLGGGGGPPGAARPAAPARPVSNDTQVYDFRRPNRISKEKLRSLEAIYERFSKSLESWVLGRVRGGVQFHLQSVEHFSFGEFTLSLPTPCAAYTFEVGGTGHHGVVDFGHDFAFFLVDRLFGGAAAPAIPSRSLTPIERMAVRMIADKVLSVLHEVWQDYVDFDPQLTGFESIPEILRVANREDPVLVANIEVTAADTRSLLLVCLPFAVLEKFFAGSGEGRPATQGTLEEQAASRELTETSVRAVRTPVAARLPAFPLSMRDLLALAPGKVLPTPLFTNTPLEVFVGSQRRFLATPGRHGASLAVRLTDGLMTPPDPDALPLSRLTP